VLYTFFEEGGFYMVLEYVVWETLENIMSRPKPMWRCRTSLYEVGARLGPITIPYGLEH